MADPAVPIEATGQLKEVMSAQNESRERPNRSSRKSLKFVEEEQIISQLIENIVEVNPDADMEEMKDAEEAANLEPDEEVVEETPSAPTSPEGFGREEVDGMAVDDVQEEPIEDSEEEDREELVPANRTSVASAATAGGSRASSSRERSSSSAVKNSTILAHGAPFTGAPLAMSPISFASSGSSNPTVRTTPSATPPRAASTNRKRPSVAQSPLFINTVQKNMMTAVAAAAAAEKKQKESANVSSTPPAPDIPAARAPSSAGSSATKGASRPNPSKGKSFGLAALDETEETSDNSDTEWEDEEPVVDVESIVRVAFLVIDGFRQLILNCLFIFSLSSGRRIFPTGPKITFRS